MPLRVAIAFSRGADPRAVDGVGKNPFELALESNLDDADLLALLSDSNV